MNESTVSAAARPALAKARVDFQLLRSGKVPQYAHYTGMIPYTNSKVYEGQGYRVTMVDRHFDYFRELGPEVVLDPVITGGQSYRYNEIDRLD